MARRVIAGVVFGALAFMTLTLLVDPWVGQLAGAHSLGPTGGAVIQAQDIAVSASEFTIDFLQLSWFVTKLLIASIVFSGFIRKD